MQSPENSKVVSSRQCPEIAVAEKSGPSWYEKNYVCHFCSDLSSDLLMISRDLDKHEFRYANQIRNGREEGELQKTNL